MGIARRSTVGAPTGFPDWTAGDAGGYCWRLPHRTAASLREGTRMLILRSLLFNTVFYGWTVVCCFGLLWTLPLHHSRLIAGVKWYMRTLVWLERTIIGLEYEIVGLEHLPRQGAFIVGAKHQSMWETMKLHLILDDPAIILKRELLFLPIWGWYAAKARMIAVNRGRKGAAVASMLEGAKQVAAEGRPICIFPQGTRVAPGVHRPYKVGIAILYEALDLPIVPMALNSGMFWGRRTFIKRPGRITIQFLPPIPPGLTKETALARLEAELEEASDRLVTAVGGPATPRAAPQDVAVDHAPHANARAAQQ